MGIDYDPYQAAIVPDGCLSRGVSRIIDGDRRLVYFLWEEQVIPQFVLAVVFPEQQGQRYPIPEETIQAAHQAVDRLSQRTQKLKAYLKTLAIDPSQV